MSLRAVVKALVGTSVLMCTPACDAAFWTTPDPVVAGQSARVVFTTSSRGGRPEVEVRVEGQQIVLMQDKPCTGVCFGTWVPALAEAQLPALQPGTYTVTLAWKDDDLPPAEVATLVVGDASTVQVLPAEGFWSPVGQPGSGLFLERRGELLAVSTYSYLPGAALPSWSLGAGDYAGDSIALLMDAYQDGDCLGCADHRAAAGPLAAMALQMRFESARRAWLDIAGVDSAVAVTSLPYGAAYIPHTLADSVDAEFGPLPLPDLRGSWMFTVEEADAPPVQLTLDVLDWRFEDGMVIFDGASFDIECRSATDTQRAGCAFEPGTYFSPPPPPPLETFYGSGWFAPLGDIREDRLRGVFVHEGRTWHVQGFRIGVPPPAGAR